MYICLSKVLNSTISLSLNISIFLVYIKFYVGWDMIVCENEINVCSTKNRRLFSFF